MPTSGHDGKVCAGQSTKVSAVDVCHARTLLGAEGQSLYVACWISDLVRRICGDSLTLASKVRT